ncbi:MAG: efflux RND transporter permease subunit [Alphaproteobacteria bacterium]
MNLIKIAIERPIAVIAAVLMAVLFGLVALTTIPIQLTPDVRKPVITIETRWPGAAPAEVEREIINEQEEVLRGLQGVEKMTSRSQDGQGDITLEFQIGQDMDRALLLVANRLDRVSSYPDEADEPTLDTSGTEDNPIAWFIVTREAGNEQPIHTFRDYIEDTVQDRLERVSGVSKVNVYGGSERELQVTVDPERMARYRLTIPEVVDALQSANISTTAGDVEEGKRRYIVRTEGEFVEPAQIEQVVIRSLQDDDSGRLGRVTVGDIASVAFAYKEPGANIRILGSPAMAVNAQRETGANVIDTMEAIKEAIAELEAGPLPRAGLTIRQVYDETVYIDSAISLVNQNILVGGALAAFMLLLFLRSGYATLIVSIAIPVSVVASFVAMAAMGRSLNVISLAGIAFAVGMVVDAAIVVLENIYRLRQTGMAPPDAAYQGASQVWGAILVSALTTVMVFIPILTMELEVGQLFRDIAVAISVAVLLSLLVAMTVIPALSKRLLTNVRPMGDSIRLPVVDDFAGAFAAGVMGFTRSVVHSRALAFAVASVVTVVAIAGAWVMLPKLEYLPDGNRNLVFGVIIPPPGYNLATKTEIARTVEEASKPLWSSETGVEPEPGGPPKIRDFFFVSARGFIFLGAQAEQEQRAGELIEPLSKPVFAEPGTFGFITQPSMFGRGIGGGRTVDLDISGPDLAQVLGVALKAAGLVSGVLPREDGNQLRPKPGLELGAPEVRLIPDRVRLADAGVSARTLATTVDAFNDGLRVAEITVDGSRIDLTLLGPKPEGERTQSIAALPVVTSSGQILPASSLADIQVTEGPNEILHLERERTVTLEIRPANHMPLESALDTLEENVVQKLRADGLPDGVKVNLAGTADELTQTWDAMVVNLALAVVIVYLVMAVLFESFMYPLIILISVPVAAAGGVGGLALLNLYQYQALDMLTLLGFVILVGIVVNNAILLVHQTLYHVREDGMPADDAIQEATRNRLRPIFMSTLTSVFGMLPLVVFPGAGSELYRGLGSVVIGGLSLSAILTLLLIPPMLSLFMSRQPASARETEAAAAPAE